MSQPTTISDLIAFNERLARMAERLDCCRYLRLRAEQTPAGPARTALLDAAAELMGQLSAPRPEERTDA